MASRASRGARRAKRIPLRRETVWGRQRSRKAPRAGYGHGSRTRRGRPPTGRGRERVRWRGPDTRTEPPTRRRVSRRQARVWRSTPIAGQPPRCYPATRPVRAPVLRKGAIPPAREGRGRHTCPASHGRSQGRCRTACRGLLSAGPASRRALTDRRGGFSCRARGRRAATGGIRCAGGVGGVLRVDGVLLRLPLGRE